MNGLGRTQCVARFFPGPTGLGNVKPQIEAGRLVLAEPGGALDDTLMPKTEGEGGE